MKGPSHCPNKGCPHKGPAQWLPHACGSDECDWLRCKSCGEPAEARP